MKRLTIISMLLVIALLGTSRVQAQTAAQKTPATPVKEASSLKPEPPVKATREPVAEEKTVTPGNNGKNTSMTPDVKFGPAPVRPKINEAEHYKPRQLPSTITDDSKPKAKESGTTAAAGDRKTRK